MSDQPVLPYGGTTQPRNSGYAAGADTSRDRALTADADGTTTRRQRSALAVLSDRWLHEHGGGYIGLDHGTTWKELATFYGWHHGQASGVLSVLHKAGKIARLTERRNRCAVYVLPEYVNGRETAPHGRQQPTGEQPDTQLAVDLVNAEAAIRRVRALHQPHREQSGKVACPVCLLDYPCPTIRALNGNPT